MVGEPPRGGVPGSLVRPPNGSGKLEMPINNSCGEVSRGVFSSEKVRIPLIKGLANRDWQKNGMGIFFKGFCGFRGIGHYSPLLSLVIPYYPRCGIPIKPAGGWGGGGKYQCEVSILLPRQCFRPIPLVKTFKSKVLKY